LVAGKGGGNSTEKKKVLRLGDVTSFKTGRMEMTNSNHRGGWEPIQLELIGARDQKKKERSKKEKDI